MHVRSISVVSRFPELVLIRRFKIINVLNRVARRHNLIGNETISWIIDLVRFS